MLHISHQSCHLNISNLQQGRYIRIFCLTPRGFSGCYVNARKLRFTANWGLPTTRALSRPSTWHYSNYQLSRLSHVDVGYSDRMWVGPHFQHRQKSCFGALFSRGGCKVPWFECLMIPMQLSTQSRGPDICGMQGRGKGMSGHYRQVFLTRRNSCNAHDAIKCHKEGIQFQFYSTAYDMNCENGGGVLPWSVTVELKTKSIESFIGVGCSTATSRFWLEVLQSHHSLAKKCLTCSSAKAHNTPQNFFLTLLSLVSKVNKALSCD